MAVSSLRRWAGRIAAVAAGFGATAVLSVAADALMHAAGVFPPDGVRMPDAAFLSPAVYRAVFTFAGGWLTARLAPNHVARHLVALTVLGSLGGVGGLVVAYSHPELGPLWYAWSILLSVPCIWLGGWFGLRPPRG